MTVATACWGVEPEADSRTTKNTKGHEDQLEHKALEPVGGD